MRPPLLPVSCGHPSDVFFAPEAMATTVDLTAEEPPRPELVQLSYDEIASGADPVLTRAPRASCVLEPPVLLCSHVTRTLEINTRNSRRLLRAVRSQGAVALGPPACCTYRMRRAACPEGGSTGWSPYARAPASGALYVPGNVAPQAPTTPPRSPPPMATAG